jgi:hypothetical protein
VDGTLVRPGARADPMAPLKTQELEPHEKQRGQACEAPQVLYRILLSPEGPRSGRGRRPVHIVGAAISCETGAASPAVVRPEPASTLSGICCTRSRLMRLRIAVDVDERLACELTGSRVRTPGPVPGAARPRAVRCGASPTLAPPRTRTRPGEPQLSTDIRRVTRSLPALSRDGANR